MGRFCHIPVPERVRVSFLKRPPKRVLGRSFNGDSSFVSIDVGNSDANYSSIRYIVQALRWLKGYHGQWLELPES